MNQANARDAAMIFIAELMAIAPTAGTSASVANLRSNMIAPMCSITRSVSGRVETRPLTSARVSGIMTAESASATTKSTIARTASANIHHCASCASPTMDMMIHTMESSATSHTSVPTSSTTRSVSGRAATRTLTCASTSAATQSSLTTSGRVHRVTRTSPRRLKLAAAVSATLTLQSSSRSGGGRSNRSPGATSGSKVTVAHARATSRPRVTAMSTVQNARTQSSSLICLRRPRMRSRRSSGRPVSPAMDVATTFSISRDICTQAGASTFRATNVVTQSAAARHPKPTENGFVSPNNFYMHRQE